MKQLIYRIIYNPSINRILRNVNKMLFPVLPGKIRIPPSGILTIRNDSGRKLFIKTNQTNYLTYLLFWEGGYQSFEYTDIFLKLITKIRTFYDIGANIGYYSLLAAMENEDIKVVGFEPASGCHYYFQENVSLNRFSNIRIECLALADKQGEIDFYEISNKKYRYLKYNLAGESNAGSLTSGRNFVLKKVKAMTLDEYVHANKEAMIDLIKIDTEGTENLIFKQAGHVLKSMRPIVICETLFNKIEKDLEEIFSAYGYEYYNHTPKGLVKVNTIVRVSDDGVRNCFFVHPDKFDLIREFVVQ